MNETPLFVGCNCDAFSGFYDKNTCKANMADGRIPSLLTIRNGKYKGNIIAAADKASCGADWGFIEIAVRVSEDNGENFSPLKTIFTPPVREYPFDADEYTSAFAIDPLMMEADDGKVVMEGTPKEIFSQVDALKALRLDVPQVTELAYELKKAGLDLPDGILTIEEFVESMAKIKGR